MGVVSLGVLNKAQEITGKAFANNHVSEQNFEYVMLFSSVRMKSLFIFPCHFVNLQAQMKCIYVLCFLLTVGIYNVHFVIYMLLLFLKKIYIQIRRRNRNQSAFFTCVFKLKLQFLVHCSDFVIVDNRGLCFMKMKQGRLGREIQTQIDFIDLTAILKCCLYCAIFFKGFFSIKSHL